MERRGVIRAVRPRRSAGSASVPSGGAGGFTLVEVLVALFLIGLAVMAVAPMFLYAIRGNAAGADLGTAGALAVERMEQLRAAPYANLANGGSLTSDVAGYVDTSHEGFVVRWQIADAAGRKRIDVRALSTRVGQSVTKEVTLSTLRGRG